MPDADTGSGEAATYRATPEGPHRTWSGKRLQTWSHLQRNRTPAASTEPRKLPNRQDVTVARGQDRAVARADLG